MKSLLIVLLFIIVGCGSTPQMPANPEIGKITENLVKSNSEIETGIRGSSERLAVVDNPIAKEEAVVLQGLAYNTAQQGQAIELIDSGIKIKDDIIYKQDEKNKELQKTIDRDSTKYLGMLIAGGSIMMVLGVLGFFWNIRTGIILLGIGGVTVGVTAATLIYLEWLALASLIVLGGGFLIMIIYLGYLIFTGKKIAKQFDMVK